MTFINRLRRSESGTSSAVALPFPPEQLRILVGGCGEDAFDNPSRSLVFPDIPAELYHDVLDFGCGCGRIARQLIQQQPRPRRYVGIDLHSGMIAWCNSHLAPAATGFEFLHHDVFNPGLNPGDPEKQTAPFPVGDREMGLVVAWSVFTHLLEPHAVHYMHEVGRVLRNDGLLHSTWFTFDKGVYPMLQDFQNALYVNPTDPTNAVIFDRDWLRGTAAEAGLKPVRIAPPEIRGFQWLITFARTDSPLSEVEWPVDDAAFGLLPPPLPPPRAHELGL